MVRRADFQWKLAAGPVNYPHSSVCSLLLWCFSNLDPRRATFSESLTLSSRTCRQSWGLIRADQVLLPLRASLRKSLVRIITSCRYRRMASYPPLLLLLSTSARAASSCRFTGCMLHCSLFDASVIWLELQAPLATTEGFEGCISRPRSSTFCSKRSTCQIRTVASQKSHAPCTCAETCCSARMFR